MTQPPAETLADKQHLDDRPIPFSTLPEALRHWATTTPTSVALTCGEDELTYAQLVDRVGRCATWMSQRGVRSGDRVVVVGHNSIAWVVHYLAALTIEAVIAPANNRLSPRQFADQVNLLDAVLVVFDDDHASLTAEVPGVLLAKLSEAEHPQHNAGSGEWTAPARGAPSDAHQKHTFPSPDAPALISFTSGTTGQPKGATLTQAALAEASWAFVRVLGTHSDDSTLVVVPMFHNTGFVDQFGHMLLLGARTDLLPRFRTAAAVEALTARPVTYIAAVPSIIRLIVVADGAQQALQPLRTVLYGGSPMPRAWIDEMLARWPHIQLFHGYGLTEYGSAISFLPPRYARDYGESVGFAVPGTAIRIVGEDLHDVPAGAVGELWCQGPTMMSAYWRRPELTAQKIHNGWLRTGDLARVDDGFYYIEGRVDDVINRGGEKILPAHLEGLLAKLDAVSLSCVYGVPDPILQQRVWAAVEERPGMVFDEQAARAALAAELPDYAVPDRINVVNPLPRTASGKVDRMAVAARLNPNTDNEVVVADR